MPDAVFFTSHDAWRAWLDAHHHNESECLVGFLKAATGEPSMSWSESVDQAICYGWIDGVRRRIDERSYSIRFTPRKRGSIWSATNVKKVEQLDAAGLMTEAGRRAFAERTDDKTAVYSYENEAAELRAEETWRFRGAPEAWAFFERQAAWYRRTALHWVTSAKREPTRDRRLQQLIDDSAAGRRLGHLTR
jgi:uncharacterized protein YdeI (YjbR/CyaY-like superfamily)